jgi:DNA-binding response OmpR family regulator
MLTARADDVDRIIGLELGADDYLPKPFNPRELAARVRAILRRYEPRPVRNRPPRGGQRGGPRSPLRARSSVDGQAGGV